MINALFIDILSNRKHVWVVIGLAAGLAYLREHRATHPRSGVVPAPTSIPTRGSSPARRSAELRETAAGGSS